MNLSITIGLVLLFLFYQQARSSSRNSFLKNQIISINKVDNVIGKFFVDFNKAYLQKKLPWHVTIIGTSTDELQQTQSLCKSYPCSICTDPEICIYPKGFNSRSFFIVFLDDVSEKGLKKNFKVIPGCRNECRYMFILKGIMIKSKEILSFLFHAIEGAAHFEIAHLDKDTVTIYHLSIEEDCSLGIGLTSVWEPGSDLSKINFSSFALNDLKGCPLPVGSFQYLPKMVIEESKNGSLTVVGGVDGILLLLIAEKLNFTIDLKYPSTLNVPDQSKKVAILQEVISGIVAFGVGRLRPTNMSAISVPYDEECVTWAVPRIFGTPENLVWAEFPWKVWALIASVFFISCVVAYVHHNMNRSEIGDQRDLGFFATVFDVLAINLGYPVIHGPSFTSGRLMLIFYLFYSMVVTTGYKASFASILATVKSSPVITNASEILEANLNAGGSLYHFNILKDQDNGSEIISKLTKRYVVYKNDSEGLHRVKYDQDFALLARRSTLTYEKQMTVKAEELIRFDILDECALTFLTVMIFREGSYLLSPINKVITRVRESGILKYFERASYVDDKTLEQENVDRFFTAYIGHKYRKIFLFYIACIIICILVFVIEILTARFEPKKKPRIARRNYPGN